MALHDYMEMTNSNSSINESLTTDSLAAWFSRENRRTIKKIEQANKLYKQKKFDKAKPIYQESAKELKEQYEKLSTEKGSFWDTLLSLGLSGSNFVAFMNLVISCQMIIDEKDWWKPTVAITDIITNIKELFKEIGERKNLNFVRKNIVAAFKYMIDFCERRIDDCDIKNVKENYGGVTMGLRSFMEDGSEMKQCIGSGEVDYAPHNTPIKGDTSDFLPDEHQPDYVPDGYERGSLDNTDDLSKADNSQPQMDYIKKGDSIRTMEESDLFNIMESESSGKQYDRMIKKVGVQSYVFDKDDTLRAEKAVKNHLRTNDPSSYKSYNNTGISKNIRDYAHDMKRDKSNGTVEADAKLKNKLNGKEDNDSIRKVAYGADAVERHNRRHPNSKIGEAVDNFI